MRKKRGLKRIQVARIRNVMNFMVSAAYEQEEKQAKQLLYKVMLTVLTGAQFEEKLGWLLATILKMQSRFKNRFKILRSKLELLNLCWEKNLQALNWKAGLLKNTTMQSLFAKIEKIPAPVKTHVLKRFLYQN